MIRNVRRCLSALALTLGTALQAHIVFADPNAAAGSYYVGFLRVSHGCAGSPTVSIRIMIPAGVTSAKPQPKPGWTLAIEKVPLATPVRSESGSEVRERITAITWSGRLDSDQFDQFGIMVKLSETPGTLYFPTIQRCEIGSNNWTMIPTAGQPWHSIRFPAPMLNVTSVAVLPMDHMKM